MKNRHKTRVAMFGKQFTFTMPAEATANGSDVLLTLVDGREQQQPFGMARFLFDGGGFVSATRLIELPHLRNHGILLDGNAVKPLAVTIERDKITAWFEGRNAQHFAGATVSVSYKIIQYAVREQVYHLSGFAILTATVNH